jgi:hypothetical protein
VPRKSGRLGGVAGSVVEYVSSSTIITLNLTIFNREYSKLNICFF